MQKRVAVLRLSVRHNRIMTFSSLYGGTTPKLDQKEGGKKEGWRRGYIILLGFIFLMIEFRFILLPKD